MFSGVSAKTTIPAQCPTTDTRNYYAPLASYHDQLPGDEGVKRKATQRRVLYVLSYYVLAVTVALFNKRVIGGGSMSFSFPLCLSALSAFIQTAHAAACMAYLKCFRRALKKLTLRQYCTSIVPCAIASGLDIGISNTSLKYVTLSFYTMVKSSAPVFVLASALVLGLERPTWALFGVMGVIAGGTLMTVWSDSGLKGFDGHGFAMVLSAAMLSGVRWSLTQLIIDEHDHQAAVSESTHVSSSYKSRRKKLAAAGPLATILYLAPIAGLLMLVMSLFVEGLRNFLIFANANLIYTLTIVVTSGTLTFFLILTEYKVVQETSVLTFAITGILKEIILIALSMAVFGDKLIPINYLGIFISIGGIAAYNCMRVQMRRREKLKPKEHSKVLIPMPPPVEPLQSFINDDDGDNEGIFEGETEELYLNRLLNDGPEPGAGSDMEGLSTIEKVKTRISMYLQPFAPRSIEEIS